MYNPYVTNAFTIRNLLIHRSGLKEVSGGTLIYGSDLSRIEVIKRFKYLDPVSGFRSKPAYQNIMYIVAGEVVAAVSGLTWEEFIKTKIFKPLDMNNSVTSYSEIINSKNVATPHHKDENFKVIPIPHRNHDNLAPCGSIYSTPIDMAKYIRLFLNDGVVKADTIISKNVLSEIFKPQILYPAYGKPFHNDFTSYGFGWFLTPKKEYTIIEHSGGVDGMRANMHMVPDLNFGAIAFVNQEESVAYFLMYYLLAKVQREKTGGIYDQFKTRREKRKDRRLKELKELIASQVKGTNLSLEINKYTGTYIDEMYGEIFIKFKNDALYIEFSHTPSFSGSLKHWHYDTFEVDWIDPMAPNGFITFVLNSKGKILELIIDQPSLLDVDFNELHIKRKN
ncbi:MAG: serine hydrolase [Bacteroidales bacterium]|nr:serine hydrolase [Bacteroidales bacterium]